MALQKQEFKDDEIPIFDEACVYKRGEYWQFRMWLAKENKYARKSLRTRSETTAVERGKAAYLEIYANLQQGKTKIITQPLQQPRKFAANDAARTAIKPITPQKPLPNQQIS